MQSGGVGNIDTHIAVSIGSKFILKNRLQNIRFR